MTSASPSSSSPPPLITIVLPVFNGERYLTGSIQSCLDQTYPHWELLVVDDASTDSTPAILAEYTAREPRIRSLRHDVNKRLPAALNTGFAHAQGAYLTWTSDDNRYRPEALSTMLTVLQSHPSSDFVYTDYDVIDEDGRFVQTTIAPPPVRFIQGYAAVPCFLYRRSLYQELGGYAEDLFLAEDYEYWLRIFASRHTMYPLHRPLYEYRRHARSLTDEHRGSTFAAAERALLRTLPHLAWAGSAVRGESYLHLASLASWQGDRARAVRYALHALPYLPTRLLTRSSRYAMRRLRWRLSRRQLETQSIQSLAQHVERGE